MGYSAADNMNEACFYVLMRITYIMCVNLCVLDVTADSHAVVRNDQERAPDPGFSPW